jgi:hypothetical protein
MILSSRPAGTKAFPSGHYIVPDTNALLNGMDLFEQTSAFYDVIILQTVLEELKNRYCLSTTASLPLLKVKKSASTFSSTNSEPRHTSVAKKAKA